MSLIIKTVKALLAIVLILTLAIIGLFTFGPVSSPTAIFSALFGYTVESPSSATIEQRLQVPEGFSISHYATDLGYIRFMAVADNGDLLVSQARQGRVIALKHDNNGDDRHDGMSILIDGLTRPHGLALHNNWLYIAESNAVGRVAFDHATGQLAGDYQRIVTGLTDDGNHWTKSLLIHNDQLLVSMGSTCNVCEEVDERRSTIMAYDLDGKNGRIFASGLRNSVGLDAAPWNGEVYATDNGRDLLGDDYPPCELNHIEDGKFYGWPYINGFGDLDPDMGDGKEALLETAQSPAFGFRAHNAPLGMRFIKNAKAPESYKKSALIALHGSWNRSSPDGYKVISLHWDDEGNISSRDFLSGFIRDGNIIGRPVDIVESIDGCLFISDDYSGTVYRACYNREQSAQGTPLESSTVDQPQFSEEQIALGEQVFNRHHCLQCHHLNNQGNTSGKSLNNLTPRHHEAETLAKYFLTPNPPMPRFPLTEDERKGLAAYLLSQPRH
jgi:glucose/arabinose dehydrogenase